MEDPAELALVLKALTSGLSNCVEWASDKTALRVRGDPDLQGFTPEGIKAALIDFVAAGGEIKQVAETRPEYNYNRFYYKALVPITGLPRGIFIELTLLDDDPDCPCVSLVNAHRQRE